MNLSKILVCLCLYAISLSAWSIDVMEFRCTRKEKDYTEEYDMKITLASGNQKAKVYLDDRDLDQSDEFGKQIVKSVTMARPNIVILIEASFAPEKVMDVAYPAGTVSTQMTLDPITGKLKKVEKIQGGILGATIGNGTQVTEESCALAKMPYRVTGK
ncbi:hypothetical protein [Polynucleobacter sp. MWH-UH2A]|uniref:hypothetical protein n=1 Tax=Polynucleobacter sp. MWH-UH2A TaxID=1855617 RepID=UPI002040EAC4|nr:hypothetical protein [Polynucleobacter sp. MWH-UH2A]